MGVADEHRDNRNLWIVIDEMDEVAFPQGELRKFLHYLFKAADDTPWLRFVLLGYSGDPAAGQGLGEREELDPPTGDEVWAYVVRRAVSLGNDEPSPYARVAINDLVAGLGDPQVADFIERLVKLIQRLNQRLAQAQN